MAFAEPRNTGMLYRRLGRSGLHVSVMSLGGWLTFGGHVADDTTAQCMKKAYDLGVNFFDCAENYAGGQSEIIMGKAIKKWGWNRNDIVVSTKINYGAAHGEVLINNHGLSRKHVVEGLKNSLKRLDLEYVDIVYAHRPDRLTPMEETVRAFDFVINQGLAFYWGTSEWRADEITEACGIAKALGLIPPVVEQPAYNLLDRQKVEGEFQRLYERQGLGLTVFSPMKGGILSGKYNIKEAEGAPPKGSRFAESQEKYGQNFRKNVYGSDGWHGNLKKVDGLKPIADKLNCTLSQLALAWCLKNPNVTSIITGASRPGQIEENVKCLQIVDKLTPPILEEIEAVVQNKPKMDPARQD